jgi:acyl carrier protein
MGMCTLISQELTKLMAEILECDAATLSGDTSFHEHANWDSIAYLSTVIVIEERFGLVPPLSQLKKISDLAAFIEGKV